MSYYEIKSLENYQREKFNYFICKIASISNDEIILFYFKNKKVNVYDIDSVCVLHKVKKLISFKIIKLLLVLYLVAPFLVFLSTNVVYYLALGASAFFFSFFLSINIIELKIIVKDGREIAFKLGKADERRAKLLIKNINKYKENFMNF